MATNTSCILCSTTPTQTHHILSKGTMGKSPSTHNHINLVPLCITCHAQVHSGQIARDTVLDVKSRSLGMSPDNLLTALYALRMRSRHDIER